MDKIIINLSNHCFSHGLPCDFDASILGIQKKN